MLPEWIHSAIFLQIYAGKRWLSGSPERVTFGWFSKEANSKRAESTFVLKEYYCSRILTSITNISIFVWRFVCLMNRASNLLQYKSRVIHISSSPCGKAECVVGHIWIQVRGSYRDFISDSPGSMACKLRKSYGRIFLFKASQSCNFQCIDVLIWVILGGYVSSTLPYADDLSFLFE